MVEKNTLQKEKEVMMKTAKYKGIFGEKYKVEKGKKEWAVITNQKPEIGEVVEVEKANGDLIKETIKEVIWQNEKGTVYTSKVENPKSTGLSWNKDQSKWRNKRAKTTGMEPLLDKMESAGIPIEDFLRTPMRVVGSDPTTSNNG